VGEPILFRSTQAVWEHPVKMSVARSIRAYGALTVNYIFNRCILRQTRVQIALMRRVLYL
jgi:hypothetical protein